MGYRKGFSVTNIGLSSFAWTYNTAPPTSAANNSSVNTISVASLECRPASSFASAVVWISMSLMGLIIPQVAP